MANWDAVRLGKMVKEGTRVRFVEGNTAVAKNDE
jgi:lipoprotein-anchoring transpeptidase ErfK/SrfK